MKKKNLSILTPMYNDWESLQKLLHTIAKIYQKVFSTIEVYVINDSSSEVLPKNFSVPSKLKLNIIDLKINVGHQRAILIGLCYLKENTPKSNYIIVMDSDGEDNPQGIIHLYKESQTASLPTITFSKRTDRKEGILFKILYVFYKFFFKYLTGKFIRFGNFSCIPVALLPKIVYNADFWNHYVGAVLKSTIPYKSFPLKRDKRYFGKSKMNLTRLIIHGLSSLSLYLDVIIVRFLRVSFMIFGILSIALIYLLYVRIFTDWAIPGWFSLLFMIFCNVLITIGLFTFLVILLHLNSRNQQPSFPISFYKKYILRVKTF